MINKIQNFIPFLKNRVSKEKNTKNDFVVTRVNPKQELQFGKIISFSFDSHSVQMAVSIHYGHIFKLIDIQKKYFTSNAQSSKNIDDFYEQCVNDFIQEHHSKFTKIYLTLTGGSTFYRTFILPKLKQKELNTAVQFEVKKIIPFPIAESYYDYRVIEQIDDDENHKVKISLHAATREFIHSQLHPFVKRNIQVDKILHSHDTIGQLLSLLHDFEIDKNYILTNISKNIIEITFYKGNTLEFSRSNSINSNILGDSNDPLKLEYFTETIANEIQNSLDFYSVQLDSRTNNKIMLYGDFSSNADFINLLNDKLDITVEHFPVEHFNFSTVNDNSIDLIPASLPALATTVNQSYLPDLLPLQQKNEKRTNRINTYLKTIAAILTLTLLSSWAYNSKKIQTLQESYDASENQITIFKSSEAYHTYKVIKQEIAYDLIYLNLAKESESFLYLNLKELSRLTPLNIKLFHLNYNPKSEDQNYYIQGIVRSNDIPPEITLAEFIEDLSSSQFYEDVQIVRHVKKKNKETFEIEFLIKMNGIV